jgi:O-antigen/teichoic acid export membrane protein
MLLVRIIAIAVAVALGVSVLLWLLTGERKWLTRAWRIFKYAVFVLALILLLMFAERLLVMV